MEEFGLDSDATAVEVSVEDTLIDVSVDGMTVLSDKDTTTEEGMVTVEVVVVDRVSLVKVDVAAGLHGEPSTTTTDISAVRAESSVSFGCIVMKRVWLNKCCVG